MNIKVRSIEIMVYLNGIIINGPENTEINSVFKIIVKCIIWTPTESNVIVFVVILIDYMIWKECIFRVASASSLI